MRAGAGAQVDDAVGAFHHDLVMLDHEQRVALVPERLERADEPFVVARVQADGRFVEHVEHAGEIGPELRGEADPLGLAAGEGLRRALKGQIAESDVIEEPQALLDLRDDVPRDGPPARIEGKPVQAGEQARRAAAAAARAARAAGLSGNGV